MPDKSGRNGKKNMCKDEKRSTDIDVSLELSFSPIIALIHTIEDLLNNHPYHSTISKKNFRHAYSMILFVMRGWIDEQIHKLDKTIFKHGKLCEIIDNQDVDEPESKTNFIPDILPDPNDDDIPIYGYPGMLFCEKCKLPMNDFQIIDGRRTCAACLAVDLKNVKKELDILIDDVKDARYERDESD